MRYWFIWISLMQVSVTFAAEGGVGNALTLNEAIIKVLEHSPQLKATDLESRSAAARIRAVQQSPAFQASVEFENFSGSGRYRGSDELETTLRLSKVLELGNKADLRGEVAQQKALLLRSEQDAKRLDLLAETTRRFIHVVTDQERLTLAKDSYALSEKTLNVVKRRVAAGKSPNAELRRAINAVARKALELEHAKHELATSRVKLAIIWGDTTPLFISADANLFLLEPTRSFDEVVLLLANNPDLIRFATQQRLSQARLKLARSRGNSDVEVTGGVRHFNDTDDTALVLSLNIPLGTSARAEPYIEEAEFSSLQDPQIHLQRQLTLHATLFEVYQEIKHAIESVSTLRETIIPNAAQALKDYENGYAAGRYSFLELTEAQRALLDARLEAVMAATKYHQYRIEIDRLTGAGLLTGVTP